MEEELPIAEKSNEKGINDQNPSEVNEKEKVKLGGIEVGILICSVLIFISVFMKWAYLQDLKMTDYLPQFKIIAAINAFVILGMLSVDLKGKRGALVGAVINLIIFTIYYFKMNESWGYGLDASKFITLHFGFWLGFLGSIAAFLLILTKIFTYKK